MMAQYQTFPGAPGDSLTLEKLKRLSLPDLEGKRFLDVGCNEGFFCGFASFAGASHSVGIDRGRGFIERARQRFPACEFHARGWDDLPDGKFDVILLASALHYAADQEALLHQLVGKLSQDGMLVLELGIFSSKKSEWATVKRGIDERLFPSMPKLREILAPYAWKWMGPSVSQAGDPVGRHVIHVSPKRRAAYLLMKPPAFGKSSIARALFPGTSVAVVSGDLVIGRIAAGKLEAPADLVAAINDDYSPFRIDLAIHRIFERGLGPMLVRMWIDQAGDADFALDMYVPPAYQGDVRDVLQQAGYLPITLEWERPGHRLMPEKQLASLSERFYMSMVGQSPPASEGVAGTRGFIDEASLNGKNLLLRGWAVDGSGNLPASLSVRVGDTIHVVEEFERQLRPDVQRHLGLAHGLVGYRLAVPAAGVNTLEELRGKVDVQSGGDSFRISSVLAPVWGEREATGGAIGGR